jgi:putative transposase
MRKFSLRPLRRAKSPKKPNDCGRPATGRPNILGKWCPIEPDIVWVSDFTFIRFHDRFLYLATVLDVFTGEVLGFNVSDSHDAVLILGALERASLYTRTLPEWFHSDQGSEFDSDPVTTYFITRGVKLSNAPKGSPWHNGAQESFFGRFKVEFGDFERFATLSELLEEIYRMLFYFLELRIKNRLKMPPAVYRRQWNKKRSDLSTRLAARDEILQPTL